LQSLQWILHTSVLVSNSRTSSFYSQVIWNASVYVCICSVTSDDILAKYRKPVAHKSADNIAACPAAVADGVTKSKDKVEDEIPLYDSNNLEMCQAFLDAKKKLRLILSSVDLQVRLPRDIFIVRFLSITFCSM